MLVFDLEERNPINAEKTVLEPATYGAAYEVSMVVIFWRVWEANTKKS